MGEGNRSDGEREMRMRKVKGILNKIRDEGTCGRGGRKGKVDEKGRKGGEIGGTGEEGRGEGTGRGVWREGIRQRGKERGEDEGHRGNGRKKEKGENG
jgi:hypothetical protein